MIYDSFRATEEGIPIAIMTDSKEVSPCFKDVLYSSETEQVSNRFGRSETGYLFESKHVCGESIIVWKPYNEPTVYFRGDMNKQLVRFAIWIGYGIVTIPHQTVAIHTSCIVQQGKAVIFLGESGTGKSTHTRLWRETIAGAELLNDDSPIIRMRDGKATVYGSPWSGKTPCYKNESYPIRAIVRLSQAPHNSMRRLRGSFSVGALLPSLPPAFAFDEKLEDAVMNVLSAVIGAVPVYHLECLPNAAAAQLSHDTIFCV